jgi:hypothetical protein
VERTAAFGYINSLGMTEARTNPSYYALRVCPETVRSTWWATAQIHSRDAPSSVRALLNGRTRVELTVEEAVRAIHWAAQLSGWDDHPQPPLFIYPPLASRDG